METKQLTHKEQIEQALDKSNIKYDEYVSIAGNIVFRLEESGCLFIFFDNGQLKDIEHISTMLKPLL